MIRQVCRQSGIGIFAQLRLVTWRDSVPFSERSLGPSHTSGPNRSGIVELTSESATKYEMVSPVLCND
jgi:hypothetical protein